MRSALTERQNEVFEYVRAHLRREGRPPTLKEIGRAMGIASPSGVRKHLVALERKGYLRREEGAARGIRVADMDLDPLTAGLGSRSLPVIGRVRTEPVAYFRVDPYFLGRVPTPERCFIGVCTDDGMSTAGIRKGDFLVIEEVAHLRSVETVAVRTGEELRVRQHVRQRGRRMLHAADRRYASVRFVPGEATILGRVVAVMRRL